MLFPSPLKVAQLGCKKTLPIFSNTDIYNRVTSDPVHMRPLTCTSLILRDLRRFSSYATFTAEVPGQPFDM